MKMLETLKAVLYQLVVGSGIMLRLIPVLIYLKPKLPAVDQSNHAIKDAKGHSLRSCKVNGKCYPPFGVEKILSIPNFKIRTDDVILCGYPKTGGHWAYEILYMLVNKTTTLSKHGKEFGGMVDAIPDIFLDSLPSPRVLNAHMPYVELPTGIKENKTKIVLTVRNPKDTAISYYHHVQLLKKFYRYEGDFEDFLKLFMNGELEYGSYFDYYLKWDEVMKTQSNNPVFLISYEDLKADAVGSVNRIAEFLEIDVSEEFVGEIVNACAFDNMKKKVEGTTFSGLYRKGVVGGWRNTLTEEQSDDVDQMWKDKMLGFSYQPNYTERT